MNRPGTWVRCAWAVWDYTFPGSPISTFFPLESLAHVYLRLEYIPVGMGCRRVPVGQYFLMAVLRNGGSYKAALTDRTCGDWALEQLHTLVPELRTGWVPGRD